MNTIEKAARILRRINGTPAECGQAWNVADELEALLKQAPVGISVHTGGGLTPNRTIQWERGFPDVGTVLYAAPVSAEPANTNQDAAKERDILAKAIYDAAVAVGIIKHGMSLSGPQLLLVLQNLSSPAESVNARLLECSKKIIPLLRAAGFVMEGTASTPFLEAITSAEQQQAQPLPELSDGKILDVLCAISNESISCNELGSVVNAGRALIAADRELRGVKRPVMI
jgi:hypothetical protein